MVLERFGDEWQGAQVVVRRDDRGSVSRYERDGDLALPQLGGEREAALAAKVDIEQGAVQRPVGSE